MHGHEIFNGWFWHAVAVGAVLLTAVELYCWNVVNREPEPILRSYKLPCLGSDETDDE
jgi:hypothetical protein